VDDLGALLDGPRARGAFLLRCLLARPWSIRLDDGAALSVTAVLEGEAWASVPGAEPVRLGPGDVVVRTGAEPWVLADGPATPVGVVIGADQACTTLDGRPLVDELGHGVRTWGHGPRADDVLLTGVYAGAGEVGARVLRALPPLLVVRAGELGSPLVGLLADEVVRDDPGQGAVLDRLLDLVLVTVVRQWAARGGAEVPRWWLAASDPVVGPALRLLQHHPERQWTVAGLARHGDVSRAAFARRFAAVVGTPPMAFLTAWRLDLAADLLLEPGTTLAQVAERVGYGTPYALSAAFTRERGLSPRAHRAAARAG
jgi:AraC-like DNA-binding protein